MRLKRRPRSRLLFAFPPGHHLLGSALKIRRVSHHPEPVVQHKICDLTRTAQQDERCALGGSLQNFCVDGITHFRRNKTQGEVVRPKQFFNAFMGQVAQFQNPDLLSDLLHQLWRPVPSHRQLNGVEFGQFAEEGDQNRLARRVNPPSKKQMD